jgi:hypothetical protein
MKPTIQIQLMCPVVFKDGSKDFVRVLSKTDDLSFKAAWGMSIRLIWWAIVQRLRLEHEFINKEKIYE